MIKDLLFDLWRRQRGNVQWRLLWLISSKFMVSVSGVVLDDAGRILLLRHRYWVPDVWGLPGGIVKSGERLEDAFTREILEETGYTIGDVCLVEVASGYKLRLEAYFEARLTGGSLVLQTSEVNEARFFPSDELPTNLLQNQRQIIEHVTGK